MVKCTLEKIGMGKVRDIYEVISNIFIAPFELIGFVTTDRISVNDKIVGEIPGRGRLLNSISNIWKRIIARYGIIDNDLFLGMEIEGIEEEKKANTSIVKKAIPIPVEIIVRNILTGSLFKEYQKNGRKAGKYQGIELPAGLKEWELLPEVLITPTTKAFWGEKDEPICHNDVIKIIDKLINENKKFFNDLIYNTSKTYTEMIYSASLQIFNLADRILAERGILLIDTKFEFGFIKTELGIQLILIDEVLTPDSSRFILEEGYLNDGKIIHLSKQILRDWISENPDQPLSEEIQKIVFQKYKFVLERLMQY
ncbi:MAG: phosphoribosylaminoimidazolesuccinocarboxamide synthase [Candidatus Pacebacteria bacterium]|nr:phosphoribosylaminoimidazolesuccinocarboxamide synthase [Candidatus Paceibacterota bacterium]